MTHRDFDRDREKPPSDEKGPTFTLVGQTFECLPRLPARVMAKVTQAVQWDDQGAKRALPDVIEAIRGSLIRRRWKAEPGDGEGEEMGRWVPADDLKRFDELIDSKDDIIETETLGSIVEWLMEEYGKRPTQRSTR